MDSMIGTRLVEELVQSVALTHLVKGHSRVSLLLLAAPESGKTTITTAANCQHVCRVAVMSGRSILKEIKDHPQTEFLLFNDMSAVRAMSFAAVNLLIVLLNQLTQDERGVVAFAGQEPMSIDRQIGILGCIPFVTFVDHRSRWKELGFISRMLPFAYAYSDELIAEIKDGIDSETQKIDRQPSKVMPRVRRQPISVRVQESFIREIRHMADGRAKSLGQIGLRLLGNYHALVRAHALLQKRHHVNRDDLNFLHAVDRYVSIKQCEELPSAASQKAARELEARSR